MTLVRFYNHQGEEIAWAHGWGDTPAMVYAYARARIAASLRCKLVSTGTIATLVKEKARAV